MAEITAALVKELRDKTGVGMMDCKKALSENDGDIDASVDWLRTKGLSSAEKKSGRIASEGLVGISVGGNAGAMVEVNAETDFVARNDKFQDFVKTVAGLALANDGNLETVKNSGYPGEDRTVDEHLIGMIATIGENMSLRRAVSLSVSKGSVTSYVHNAVAPGLGKIGVLVALESEADESALEELARQLAMHIAATNPQSLSQDDLDPATVERERDVLSQQARESGRPEEIIEKMVEGRMRKFFEETVLLSQTWVHDNESKVENVIQAKAKELGVPVAISGFSRFALGEGIAKKEEDFAAEVAAVAGS